MKKPTDIKQKIEAAKTTADLDELRELARDSFVYVRAGVAINPATPKDILLSLIPEALRSEDDFQVSAELLKRDELLREVARKLCAAVRQELASIQPRGFYPRRFWELLVNHPSILLEDLRELLGRKACPKHLRGYAVDTRRTDVLEFLTHDLSSSIASRAKRHLSSMDADA